MSDSELIDWEQLSMIFGDEDEDLDEDMAELFQEFVEDGLQRFEAIQRADFPAQKEFIAKESHKLKGSASNFGFVRVATALGRIEDEIATIEKEEFVSGLSGAGKAFELCLGEVMRRYPMLQS